MCWEDERVRFLEGCEGGGFGRDVREEALGGI